MHPYSQNDVWHSLRGRYATVSLVVLRGFLSLLGDRLARDRMASRLGPAI